MVLAMMSLALPGHREHVDNGDCNGGNFLALVAMQAWFDPVASFFFGVRIMLGMNFNYLILWVRVKGQG